MTPYHTQKQIKIVSALVLAVNAENERLLAEIERTDADIRRLKR